MPFLSFVPILFRATLFFFFSILEHSQLAMLYQFQVYSQVIQFYMCVCVCVYTCIYFFQILSLFRLIQNIEHLSLCYTEALQIKCKIKLFLKTGLLIFIYLKNFIYLAVSGLSCDTWDLCCGTWTLQLWHVGSVIAGHGLSCSAACGILVPGNEPMFPMFRGRFLSTGPPGKCLYQIFICRFMKVVWKQA